MLRGYVPKYLCDLGKFNQNQTIVNNLMFGLSNHLSGKKTTLIVMAKNIVYTLASSNKSCSSKHVAQVLSVDHRNIKKGIERRVSREELSKD